MITHFFIDFDGVMTDNNVYVMEDGSEMVKCSRADGIGLQKLIEKGVIPIIISTEKNDVVWMRAKKLGIGCMYGVPDKVKAMLEFCDDLSKAAFLGNDVNDFDAMQAVGYPMAVLDANVEIKRIAKKVIEKRGGQGAVREACGWIMTKLL